ncbi:hypothetical protein [Psychroserpens sp. MEBiC05023]
MKKLILIAVAFISLQAVAQDKHKGDRRSKAEHMKNMSAEDQATIITKKMTLALDLNEKQQSQVKEVMLEEANFRKQKMKEKELMRDAKKTKSSVKIENVKEIDPKAINNRLDRKIEVKKKMKSILSEEQYNKWEKMQVRRHGQMKQKVKTKH